MLVTIIADEVFNFLHPNSSRATNVHRRQSPEFKSSQSLERLTARTWIASTRVDLESQNKNPFPTVQGAPLATVQAPSCSQCPDEKMLPMKA
jgi:hypothetical protein